MKTIFKRLITGSFVFLFAIALYSNTTTAQEAPPTEGAEGETIVDKLSENEETTEFAALLDESGFADVLQQEGPFTVLAPSNEALQSGEVDVEAVKEDPAQVQQLVQSHLYKGEIPSEQVESSMGVGIENSDDSADNGTIYVVDQVVQQQQQQGGQGQGQGGQGQGQ